LCTEEFVRDLEVEEIPNIDHFLSDMDAKFLKDLIAGVAIEEGAVRRGKS